MDTLARISTFRLESLRLQTQWSTDFVDITERVSALVLETGLDEGLVNIRSWQPLTAVVIGEPRPAIGAGALLRTGSPICVDIEHGQLRLEPRQRIVLVDLDGPAVRDVSMLLVGDGVE